jgi:hypothetical protein
LRDLQRQRGQPPLLPAGTKLQLARRQEEQEQRGVIPMTDLVLNAAPLFAKVKPRLEALGALLAQAIDAFAEAWMRKALPARLLQKELERDRENVSASSSSLSVLAARGVGDPISKESLSCSF